MGLLECSDRYWEFAGQCTQCGHCTQACESLTAAGMTLGEIAKALLEAERGAASREEVGRRIAANPQLVQAVRGCFFCTSCKNTCFAHNDVCDLIYHARIDFQNLGLIERNAWSSVLVDQEWDIFTAYRAIHGIGYPDLVKHVEGDYYDEPETDCDVAFFPGCSMAAYGPELTREIFDTIEELGGKTTMIDHCCGSPLKSAGFYDRATALIDRIADEVRTSGAGRVVCVCPGCANAMEEALVRNGIDARVQSLSSFLLENGYRPARELPEGPLCLSKSCQDRDGAYLAETCELLGLDPRSSVIFHGCCGAGGAVGAFNPDQQQHRVDYKLSFAEDGSTVITMCPTCTYTYAFRLSGAPRDVGNKHYAELLFDSQFDWELVFEQLNGMWSGEYGQWLSEVFA